MQKPNFPEIDIDLASRVQRLLFPKGSPVCDWCCVGVRNRMALGLGGDYFDFIQLENDCQLVFLGDVTGHGLQASIVMSLLYGFLHRASANGCTPLETATQVNRFLQLFAKRSRKFDHYFSTTLFYSIINPATLVMSYVNAGHVAPLVCRDEEIFKLTPTAQPLGYFDDPELEMKTFQFQKRDRLLLFTDGVSESFNSRGELFGVGRIEELLRKKGQDHRKFLDTLFQALEEFGAANPPEDDCTAIVLDIQGF
jgi:sigma-B regulation protein RsbU (phosphoserine phosphatase)